MTESIWTRRSFVAACAGALACGALATSACGLLPEQPTSAEQPEEAAPATVSICFDAQPQPVHAGIYAARERGYFSKAGIELAVVLPDAEHVPVEGVQQAGVEFGIASQRVLADAFGRSEPYSVLAVAALLQRPASASEPYPMLLIANDTYLVRCPVQARAFVDAVRKGYRYAAKKPAKAAELLVEHAPKLKVADVERALVQLASAYEQPGEDWGFIEQQRWDAYFSDMWQARKIEREIPAHHGYSTDYLYDER